VNANTGRFSDAIQRLLPFIIVVLIVTFAYFWFIQTPLNAYLRTRTDLSALQARWQTARESVARLRLARSRRALVRFAPARRASSRSAAVSPA